MMQRVTEPSQVLNWDIGHISKNLFSDLIYLTRSLSFVNIKPIFFHDVKITRVVVVVFFPVPLSLGWFSANKKQSLFFQLYVSLGSVVCFIVCQCYAYGLFGFMHKTTRWGLGENHVPKLPVLVTTMTTGDVQTSCQKWLFYFAANVAGSLNCPEVSIKISSGVRLQKLKQSFKLCSVAWQPFRLLVHHHLIWHILINSQHGTFDVYKCEQNLVFRNVNDQHFMNDLPVLKPRILQAWTSSVWGSECTLLIL